METLEQGEKFFGVEGLQSVVGGITAGVARRGDYDYGELRLEGFQGEDQFVAGHVGHAGVGDYAVDGGELAQDFDGLMAAVGGDDVEFGGFDDQLAGRDAGGGFAVNDEEAGTEHAYLLARIADRWLPPFAF